MINRSQWILDIERDLRLISERLHTIEDQFEDAGLIVQIAESVHRIAVEIEQIKMRVVDGDGE